MDAEWLTEYTNYQECSFAEYSHSEYGDVIFENIREDIKRLLRKTTIPEMHLSIVSMEKIQCVTKENMIRNLKREISIGDTLENFIISGSYSKYCSLYQNCNISNNGHTFLRISEHRKNSLF